MHKRRPNEAMNKLRVSIGLPVFNGERFLAAALDSLLAQELKEFELIVSDNASTDRTRHICESYLKKDSRIRYYRQRENIGAPRNWNFVFEMARAPLFKWSSASDLVGPAMLKKCCQELETTSDLVLCATHTCFIDDDGREIGVFDKDFSVVDERPSERFRLVSNRLSINNLQSGVIRSAALRHTRLDRLYPHGDLVLMAELALLGKFRLLQDVLLYRRIGAEHFTGMRREADLAAMFRPGDTAPIRFLVTRRHMDYLLTAVRAAVPLRERMRAARFALQHAYWNAGAISVELRALLS